MLPALLLIFECTSLATSLRSDQVVSGLHLSAPTFLIPGFTGIPRERLLKSLRPLQGSRALGRSSSISGTRLSINVQLDNRKAKIAGKRRAPGIDHCR
jgi:hypothetical protein